MMLYRHGTAWATGLLGLLMVLPAKAQGDAVFRPFVVAGDAIEEPLSPVPGDVSRGRAIVVSRQSGLCLLCHTGPFTEERLQGSLAPDLAGVGRRWSAGQLRLRIADARRLNPQSLMPSYHRVEGLTRVGAVWQDRPLLSAQQVEDVVAFLGTLRE
jgi:sulfur-oxidizing protein SoxX